jgi:tetratricopeptide (TPR) repeat protein
MLGYPWQPRGVKAETGRDVNEILPLVLVCVRPLRGGGRERTLRAVCGRLRANQAAVSRAQSGFALLRDGRNDRTASLRKPRNRRIAAVNTALREQAAELTAVTIEQGSSARRNHETVFRAWLEVGNGDPTKGISLLRSALAGRSGEVWTPHYMALLARACEIAGDIEEPLTLLDDALQIVQRTGERWFAAELTRCKGELLLRRGCSEAAEKLYREALRIAEGQEAKLWELRAAVSLAHLRRDQDRHVEPATCSRPSTVGSPKASTRRI